MNTKTYGQTLRATAEAIERSERIARYIEEGGAPPTEYGARVSWPWKFDIPGYEDARQYVQQRIEAMLPQLLQESGVQYEGKAVEQPSLFAALLINALPFLLLIGLMVFAMRQFQKGGGAGGAMGFGKSKAKLLTEKSGRVTFDDVAGIEEAREELEEIVEFLKYPKKFENIGAEPIGSSPEEMSRYLSKEIDRWGKAITINNIKAD